MTTIAFRDGIMAADTAMAQGSIIVPGALVKIFQREDGKFAGSAGSATFVHAFSQWFLAGNPDDERPKGDEGNDWIDRGIICWMEGDQHMVRIFEPKGSFDVIPPFIAIGSGKELAMGAMYAGATAEEAVGVAAVFDPFTALPLTVLKSAGD